MSGKRKGVLLLLKNGRMEMEEILRSLDTTRQALLPQMKVLEEHYLVDHYDDTYELTTIGKLIVDEIAPLLNTVETLDSDIDYWGNRNLDFIPPHLFKRISELEECTIVNPSITKIYELNDKITDSCYNSDSVSMIAASFHPDYPAIFSEMANKNVKVNAIFSKDVLEHLQKNYYPFLEEMIKGKSFNISFFPKLDLVGLIVNDHYMLMRILKNNNEVDGQYILCNNPTALEWGKELFEYYLKDSVPINEISS